MEVTEQRTLRALAAGQTVQVGKKGIREITGVRGTRANHGGRRGAQVSAVLGEKILPSRLTPFGTSGGQCQIFQMQRAEIFFELRCSERTTHPALSDATFRAIPKFSPENPQPCALASAYSQPTKRSPPLTAR